MELRFSAKAEADLEAIADYIAMDSPQRAISFVTELRNACVELMDYPRRYPLVDASADFALRRRPFGNYLIFYHVGQDSIVVSRILSASLNVEDADYS